MPCRVDEPDDGADKRENNRLTRMLCHIADNLSTNQMYSLCLHCPELKEWVQQHEREDAERIQREALQARDGKRRQELLNVLSSDDLRVLGIKTQRF
jgi:hypothetical protein